MALIFLALGITCLLALVAYAAGQLFADEYAGYEMGARLTVDEDTAADLAHFAKVRDLPETTAFDVKPDVVRANLRSVPPVRHLRVAPLLDDGEWAALMRETGIPEQRQPGDAS